MRLSVFYTLVNICSQAVKINWIFNIFFSGPSNCLQNSVIAYLHWQYDSGCVCVFMFGFTSAWKRWTLIWRMFAKFMTNLMGKKPTNRLSQQRRQCLACACARYSVALLISVSVFFCVWLFLITFLARLWSRRDRIEKGYPTVDENWTHTKQVFVCEYGALYVHLCSMCIILDLCTATRLLHTIISFCITVSLSYAIYYILFFISFLVGIHTILV